jgi:hypothetical protein
MGKLSGSWTSFLTGKPSRTPSGSLSIIRSFSNDKRKRKEILSAFLCKRERSNCISSEEVGCSSSERVLSEVQALQTHEGQDFLFGA